MLHISMNKIAETALTLLLHKEKDELACFRFREFRSGCGAACRGNVRRVLRITLDTPEEGDDMGQAAGITFVMDEVLTANYGKTFFISLDANQTPTVWPLLPLLK